MYSHNDKGVVVAWYMLYGPALFYRQTAIRIDILRTITYIRFDLYLVGTQMIWT